MIDMYFHRITAIAALILLLTALEAGAVVDCKPEWANSSGDISCQKMQDNVEGTLRGGETISWSLDLSPGQFSFAAWASLDLKGLKMVVRDAGTGVVITQDDNPDNQPLCEFSLASAARVDVELIAGEERVAGTPGAYVFVAATGTGCFNREPCPVRGILNNWAEVVAQEGFKVVKWRIVEISGTNAVNLDFNLPPGSYAAIAETTHARDDIDMFIHRGTDTILDKNEEPDNTPLCEFELGSQADITVELYPWTYEEEGRALAALLIVSKE
jgi:hypothetical protein